MTQPLSLLIDSNIFIAAADHSQDGHMFGSEAAELLRACHQLGFRVIISSGTKADLERAGARRDSRERELAKFYVVAPVPVPADLAGRAGFPPHLSPSDAADLEVLATFKAGLGDWLISNDARFRKRAKRVVNDPDTVYSLAEAVDALRRLQGTPTQMPSVLTCKAYELNLGAQIFEQLESDYPATSIDAGFEDWWRTKVVAEERAAIILGRTHDPEGVAVLKVQSVNEHGLSGSVMKLCTFKVADDFAGTKRGEALLKGVLDFARLNAKDTVFVEVLPTIESLPGWLEAFGFYALSTATTTRGETVYVKHLEPPSGDRAVTPHEHAVRYGPGSVLIENAYLVPIKERWHSRLLPEAEQQLSLIDAREPCGNAIRKAYVCRSNTRLLREGDLLVFVRTGAGEAHATCTGVVDATCVASDPDVIAKFVGARTVYSREEIRSMCADGDVLAIRFRLDRVLRAPWSYRELVSGQAMKRTPQSIAGVGSEGVAWIRSNLGA